MLFASFTRRHFEAPAAAEDTPLKPPYAIFAIVSAVA